MIRGAPTANRYVEEAENERQYQKHVNAIKNMKPSINTHAEIKNKDKKLRNPRVRIFNGQTALNNGNQPMVATGVRKEKPLDKLERRPKTAMNYVDIEFDIENDNENENFNSKKHKKPTDADLCSISENSSELSEVPNQKKQNINDNSCSPEKKDITDFDIFSINSAKSRAEKEREDLTTNLYHPYIASNSARTKAKTAKPENQQPISTKKSRIPLSRQDNAHHNNSHNNNNNNPTARVVKKVTSAETIPKNTVSKAKPKVKSVSKTERTNNNEETDNSSANNVVFKPQKVSSARRKAKIDNNNNNNNHPHMNQFDKQQIQAQQRQQQRILKQQQEKLERQERLEKLEKQRKKISANPSNSQLTSSPSTPTINKNNVNNKILHSPNSKSSLANKKQANDVQKQKSINNDSKKFFQTEISLSKAKTKNQNEERLSKTENDNDDILLPCQPILAEPAPKVTFGADMWDTSDDEDEDEDENENENLTTDVDLENNDQFEIQKSDNSSIVSDISEKNDLSDIEEENGIHDDFVCSDDFSSDNDF